MQDTLAHWTGDPFPMPPPDAVAAPTPAPRADRTRRWSFEIGREGIAICSTVEDYRPRIVTPAQPRPTLALTAAAVAGGFALLMVGASAGRAWSPAPQPAEAAMIVPAARPVATPTARARAEVGHRTTVGRIFPTAEPATLTDTPVAAGGLSRGEAVTKALGTGEFQEWAERDGTTGFAVAGPAEATAQGNCRALAVLTRKIDGSDSVASSRECRATSAPSQP